MAAQRNKLDQILQVLDARSSLNMEAAFGRAFGIPIPEKNESYSVKISRKSIINPLQI